MADSTSKSTKEYAKTKLQMRLHDGSAITETFDAKEQLSAVRLFLQMKLEHLTAFGLMTSFPRKVFGESDYDMTLESLGK